MIEEQPTTPEELQEWANDLGETISQAQGELPPTPGLAPIYRFFQAGTPSGQVEVQVDIYKDNDTSFEVWKNYGNSVPSRIRFDNLQSAIGYVEAFLNRMRQEGVLPNKSKA